MTCKHNWHFIRADSDTLKCQRCGVETGPKPYEQRVKDMLEEPRAWFTIDELNDWADRYLAKQKEKTMTDEDEEFNRIEREANMRVPPPDSIAKYMDALVKGTHEISSLTIRPKRAWVGMTQQERKDIWREAIGWGDPSHDDMGLMIAIEAKLQEKNT